MFYPFLFQIYQLTFSADEIYKSAKLAPNGHAKANGKQPAVSDASDEDTEAGPSAPPDDEDEDYGPDIPDDEEGRFFGGGVSKEENEILDYMEGQDEADIAPIKYDSAWLRKFVRGFEEKISKNAEMRIKYEDDATKFMASEADLDDAIKALGILCHNAHLFKEFAELGSAASLVGLLAHENTDIAISTIRVIAELLGEDNELGDSADDLELGSLWDVLADAMMDADLVGLIMSNLNRFDPKIESDKEGILDAMTILEILGSVERRGEQIARDTDVVEWLMKRLEKKEVRVTDIQANAGDVLAVFVNGSSATRKLFCESNRVDRILQLLAKYRRPLKAAPADIDDEEMYMSSIFEIVTAVVGEPEGKEKFLEAEGVELCLIMIRESSSNVKELALRLLDHAQSGQVGADMSERLVEAAGLKVTFTVFNKNHNSMETEHLLGIFASLMRRLPVGENARTRTLMKFMEKDYKTIEKLYRLRKTYVKDAAAALDRMRQEWRESDARAEGEEFNPDKSGSIWFCLRTIDLVLAWLVAEDDGAAKKIKTLLAEQDETLAIIKASLEGKIHNSLHMWRGTDML